MDKNTVPQDYTIGLALFDAVPVLLFGMACLILSKVTGSLLILIGGIVCFAAGMLKVLWKIIVVVGKKNIWPLFVQMRIGMPAGFTLMIIGFVISCFRNDMTAFWNAVLRPVPAVFLILSVIGMAGMIVCASKLDSSDARANWIEQGCNTAAQGAFLIAMLSVGSFLNVI